MSHLTFEVVEERWQKLYEKLEEKGYLSLTSEERVWFNVRSVMDAINSGGIGSFYASKWFESMNDTLEDLTKLKIDELQKSLLHINSCLPEGTLDKEADEISDILADLGDESDEFVELLETVDELFAEIEEEIEAKLEPVIKRLIG